MPLVFLLVFSSCWTVIVQGVCKDLLSSNNFIYADDGKRLTSCKQVKNCYAALCEWHGGEGHKCCKTCRKLGSSECLGTVTKCAPIFIYNKAGTKKRTINSCKRLNSRKMQQYCDAYGQKCCHTCKGICIDQASWRYGGHGCKTCSCVEVAKMPKLMEKCCKKDTKGKLTDGSIMRCRQACCKSCEKMDLSNYITTTIDLH